MHQICGHGVDLVDADHAAGMVYCRAEHEDRGRWYFARRRHHHWYSAGLLERPAPDFQSWPGWEDSPADLPHLFPTWERFWARSSPAHISELTESP
jgi:hypothetical protein